MVSQRSHERPVVMWGRAWHQEDAAIVTCFQSFQKCPDEIRLQFLVRWPIECEYPQEGLVCLEHA